MHVKGHIVQRHCIHCPPSCCSQFIVVNILFWKFFWQFFSQQGIFFIKASPVDQKREVSQKSLPYLIIILSLCCVYVFNIRQPTHSGIFCKMAPTHISFVILAECECSMCNKLCLLLYSCVGLESIMACRMFHVVTEMVNVCPCGN